MTVYANIQFLFYPNLIASTIAPAMNGNIKVLIMA